MGTIPASTAPVCSTPPGVSSSGVLLELLSEGPVSRLRAIPNPTAVKAVAAHPQVGRFAAKWSAARITAAMPTCGDLFERGVSIRSSETLASGLSAAIVS
jgi:hypothetical protein